MGYREKFFKENKGKKRFLQTGLWYQCVSCGEWFRKEDITIDHRIAKRNGGTDDMWNLQAMCKTCNSRKRHTNTTTDVMQTFARATLHGDLDKAIMSIAKRKIKDAVGIKYVRK